MSVRKQGWVGTIHFCSKSIGDNERRTRDDMRLYDCGKIGYVTLVRGDMNSCGGSLITWSKKESGVIMFVFVCMFIYV